MYVRAKFEKNLDEANAIFLDMHGDSLSVAYTKKQAIRMKKDLQKAIKFIDSHIKKVGKK